MMTKVWAARLAALGVGVVAALGCGSTERTGSMFTPPVVVPPDTGGPVGPIGTGDAGEVLVDAADAGSCVPTYVNAETKTLNLLILLDKSSSTQGTKWNAAVTALTAFVNDARSAGVRVGLQFFPRPADAVPLCSFGGYAGLRVPFTLLPGGAAALQSALQSASPDGTTTPTYPALGGALLATANEITPRAATDVGAVLLVTDGEPVGPAPLCAGVDPTDPAQIGNIARTALQANPPVRTFVIGLPGVAQTTIDAIAAAGGTTKGFLIDGTQVESALTQALVKVRSAAIPCEYGLPSEVISGAVSLSFVNVSYTSAAGAARETIPQTSDCSTGGWTYRGTGASTAIVICPTTCDRLRGSATGKVDVALGCATLVR
jgi:hypothetical protein